MRKVIILFLVFCSVLLGAQNYGTIGQPGGGAVSGTVVEIKYQSSDQNLTNTTYVAATDLTFDVESGKKYVFVLMYCYEPASGGFKMTLDGTATASTFLQSYAPLVETFGEDIATYAGGVASPGCISLRGSVEVSGSGTFGLEVAQFDTDGGTTVSRKGNYMTLTEVQ